MKLFVKCKVMAATMLALSTSQAWATELPNVALPQADKATLDYGLKATKLAGDWYVIAGANDDFSIANGCNIINTGFLFKDGKVVVINTGTSRLYGEQQRQLIDGITNNAPVEEVIALNLHPDYFMGNQAYDASTLAATKKTIAGITAEGPSYEDNLYRLCGDWMKATEMVAPALEIKPDEKALLLGKPVEIMELAGHTSSDLVVYDRASGVLWAGGLVFHKRIITTPHATLKPWLDSLKKLKALKPKVVIPSHGPVAWGSGAIDETIDFVQWLDGHLTEAAEQGLTMNELIQMGVPERFRGFAAYPAEYLRNLTHLYPKYEKAVMGSFR